MRREEAWEGVRRHVAELLECNPADVRMDAPFGALGVDSLMTAELVEKASATSGRELGEEAIAVETPAELVDLLLASPASAARATVGSDGTGESDEIAEMAPARGLQVTSRASLVRTLHGLKRQLGLDLDPAGDAVTDFWDVHAAMEPRGGFPWNIPTDNVSVGSVDVDGRTLRVFSSYSYLGLVDHPDVKAAAIRACEPYGTGAHGVRALLGDLEIHRRLEDRIAGLYGRESALLFSSGYLANLGVLPALIGERDYVLMDALSHVSLLQGCQLSRAKILRFQHNDLADAEAVYQSIPPDELRAGARVFMVADSVFSMDGDVFDLPRAHALCRELGVFLILDEAHAFGCIGPAGLGIEDHYGMPGAVDLVIGTLSKGIPSMGGFATGSVRLVEFLRHGFAAPNTFSSPLSPYHCGAALATFEIMEAEPDRLRRLHEVSDYLRRSLRAHGFDTGLSETPIVPLVIGSEIDAIFIWRYLFEHGFFTAAVIAPAVALGKARLRLIAHAEHSAEDVDAFMDCLLSARTALAAGEPLGAAMRARPRMAGGRG
jgi:8-amino-7-oxononanoate synthase